MIPVYQTNDPGRFGPTNNGDCFRACLPARIAAEGGPTLYGDSREGSRVADLPWSSGCTPAAWSWDSPDAEPEDCHTQSALGF